MERICDYPFSPNEEFYIKIRRMRNSPIESLRLLLGPSINAQSLELKGLEVRDLGVDIASRGRLWKIFVQNQNSPLQNGIWAKMVVSSNDDGAWAEVFDHGSNVDQSGSRFQIVAPGSL
jgi:hypothetical protein